MNAPTRRAARRLRLATSPVLWVPVAHLLSHAPLPPGAHAAAASQIPAVEEPVAAPAEHPDSLGYLNLGFESRGYAREWYTGSEGYAVQLDTITVHAGRQSLCMRYVRPGRMGVATVSVPGRAVAGRRLRIRAAVRTEGVITGWAGLWCRVDGRDRLLGWASSRESAARGTTPWRVQEIELPVDSAAVEVHFGAAHAGDGVAWFDGFELVLDGVPWREPPEPARRDPDPQELDWIRARAFPITTDDPGQDCSDLVPVLRLIGNSRVVGLGEGTHGTREFSRMKHRLFRCMVEELGFTMIAMESNLIQTERLNRYVLTGEGDPEALLRSMRFTTWTSEEVLSLLRWVREHNANARVPVSFVGFDILDPLAPADSLLRFARRADPDGFDAIAESLRVVAHAHEVEAHGTVGTAMAVLRGEPLAGKRLRLRGWIRTEAVDSGDAALWIRAEDDSGRIKTSGLENAAKGTSPWRPYETELRVPPRARRIAFGALLHGQGAAWFDSIGLEVEGRTTRPGPDFDFGFEDERRLGGLRLSGAGYRADADTSGPRFGHRSLRLRLDPLDATEERNARWDRAVGAARAVLARMEAESLGMASRATGDQVALALRNARLVQQGCEAGRHPPVRDRAMAGNLAWLLDQAPPGTRVALWAHNAHVSRRENAMGAFLAERFGAGYWNIALAFHEGAYTAMDGRDLRAYDGVPSQPGSLEWALHRTGIPLLALDLRGVSAADSASAWLAADPEFRTIGLLPVGHGFHRTRVAHDFDAVLFVDRASPSRPLSRKGPP
jgi:erythromycin esterase-like protein